MNEAGTRTSKSKFSFYEFFAGAGMARLGLAPAWDCLWANDNDPRKVAIYEHNYGKGHIDPRDVGLVAQDVEAGIKNTADGIPVLPSGADMAWASFPCQDLSLAGWQRGMSAERSGAYWPFWKIMYALQQQGRKPPIIVIENVKGLLYGDSFSGLCESLAALGMRFGAVLADADRRRGELALLGLESSIEQMNTDTGSWHRVYIGPFDSRSAMAKARALTAQSDIDTLLLKRAQ